MAVIQTPSVSFDAVLADLTAYVTSKQTYNAAWKDFFAAGAGQTLMELMAGLATYEQFTVEALRRDTFLQECRLRSSAIAIANNVGYSVFRGSNPHYTITATPTATSVLPKFTQVGTYKSYPVVLANDTTLNAGVSVVFDVIIGTPAFSTIAVPSASLQPFRFSAPNISADYTLSLNTTLLPTSTAMTDLINDTWVVATNPQGAVDCFYSNLDTSIARVHKYTTGDTLRVDYIILAANIGIINTVDIALSIGSIQAIVEVSEYEPPESLQSIRVNAPYAADSQHVVRSRSDFSQLFSTTVPNMQSVVGHDDISLPYEHFISYFRTDLTVLTPAEKVTFAAELLKRRPLGVMPATIIDPVAIPSTLDVQIYVKAGSAVTGGTATTDVNNIITPLVRVLGNDFTSGRFISTLEQSLESSLAYAQTARLVSSLTTPLRWYEYSIPTVTVTLL